MASRKTAVAKRAPRAPRAGRTKQTRTAPPGRALLKERAYRELKELIQSGQLPPQASLSERQLAERLGMSKTPIRAALENLETQGLVAVSPQKGVLVLELSAREVGDLFEVRQAVEPFVAAQLARRGAPRELRERIKVILKEQRSAVRREDAAAATRLDILFHRSLAEGLDNRELSGWLERCFDMLQRSVLRINRLVAGRLGRSTQDHERIADAIFGGDADAAAAEMLSHLRYGRQFLLEGPGVEDC